MYLLLSVTQCIGESGKSSRFEDEEEKENGVVIQVNA